MRVAQTVVRDVGATSDAGQALGGLARRAIAGSLAVVAQPGGTPALPAQDLPCRALKDTGTLAACALRNGPGM